MAENGAQNGPEETQQHNEDLREEGEQPGPNGAESIDETVRSRRVSLALGAAFALIAIGFLSFIVPRVDQAVESKTLSIVIGGESWTIHGEAAIDRVQAQASATIESERERIRRVVHAEYHTAIDHAFEGAIEQAPVLANEYHSLSGWALRVSMPGFGDLDEHLREKAERWLLEKADLEARVVNARSRISEEVLPTELRRSAGRLGSGLRDVLEREPGATRSEGAAPQGIDFNVMVERATEQTLQDREELKVSMLQSGLVASTAFGPFLVDRILQRTPAIRAWLSQSRWASMAPIGRALGRSGMRSITVGLATIKSGPGAGIASLSTFVIVGSAEAGAIVGKEKARADVLVMQIEWALLAEREALKCRTEDRLAQLVDGAIRSWEDSLSVAEQSAGGEGSFRIFGRS